MPGCGGGEEVASTEYLVPSTVYRVLREAVSYRVVCANLEFASPDKETAARGPRFMNSKARLNGGPSSLLL